MTREGFRNAVFERDGGRCVSCGVSGVPLDAHHIVERYLWPDGGYYLDNGATLCDPTCHMRAESTDLSADEVRRLAGIRRVLLPPHLYDDATYDKWGNEFLPDGTRLRGELFYDESVSKVIAPFVDRFSRFTRPPRTYHLPRSLGKTPDDRTLPDLSGFEGRRVVLTVKLDGGNVSVYGPDGYIHGRRTEPLSTPDAGRVKELARRLGPELPEGWRLAGEDLYRARSLLYRNLPAGDDWFFSLFGIWNARNEALPWGEVEEWAELLGLKTPPVLYRGPFDPKRLRELEELSEYRGDPVEGYVVRVEDGFELSEYRKLVGKYVRGNFRGPAEHAWRSEIRYNAPAAS